VPMPPTDPLIYRFYELVLVNGPAWKALIEEEFGDGIMSAIDFDLTMERLPNPKGDRVKITMSGKFLPFKYYGATGNAQEYGGVRLRSIKSDLDYPSAITRRSIWRMLFTPQSAMLTSSSLRMSSRHFVTPASPPAPRP